MQKGTHIKNGINYSGGGGGQGSSSGIPAISQEPGNTLILKDDGLYSGKEIYHLTKEEYEALPDDETGKQNPNVLYNIVDENTPTLDALPFRFGITEDGQYGYYKVGADTVTPFKSDGGNTESKSNFKDNIVITNQKLENALLSNNESKIANYFKDNIVITVIEEE